LHILCRLHRDKSDPEDHFAHRELGLIKKQLEVDRIALLADGKWQIFTKKTYRKRLILALMLLAGGQNVGVLVSECFLLSIAAQILSLYLLQACIMRLLADKLCETLQSTTTTLCYTSHLV